MSCGIADGYKILRRESYTDKIGRHTVRDEMSTCAAELLATAGTGRVLREGLRTALVGAGARPVPSPGSSASRVITTAKTAASSALAKGPPGCLVW